jgi:hypothetical protein
METATPDIESFIAQTAVLTWEDPSSQLESIPHELVSTELLPLVGRVISQKTQNNQFVNAALTKAWFFATPFSFAVLGPNLFVFKFSKKGHATRILKKCVECQWFSLIHSSLVPLCNLRRPFSFGCPFMDLDTWSPPAKYDHKKCHCYRERLRYSDHGGGQQ